MSESNLFLTCSRGIEPLLAAEARALGARDTHEHPGGVAVIADTTNAYRLCLWSRLANRVLLPLAQFQAADADALYNAARGIDWPVLFNADKRFAIQVAGRVNGIANTHFAALRVKDAVVDAFRAAGQKRPDVDTREADISLHLHLGTTCSLSLDLCGESLHRRGYRVAGVEAPLKENLAAAILARCGWPDAGKTLVDPMCGSGTLVIEAALMAFDIAPGLARRRWGFEAWQGFQPAVWQAVRDEAVQRRAAGLQRTDVHLAGHDLDADAVSAARANGRRAGLTGKLSFEVHDALALPAPTGPGLLVCNLPYGERLSSEAELVRLYSLFGANLKAHFGGWRCGLFTPRTDLTPRLGLRAEKINSFYNGPIECRLLQLEIPYAAAQTDYAEDFANRLRKNLKHLGRWAKRSGATCYRLYDADLPDYAVAVDLYTTLEDGLHVHVQEYAAPKTIDPIQAEKRLRAALATLLQVLELPPDHLHYKQRRMQKGTEQYQRTQERARRYTVDEHGCRLLVDFDSYLDTGLFLDHRPMRLRLQQDSRGRRVLNLFCYTGSATVQAVLGGALRTVSVDLSKTYLEWTRDTLAANGAGAGAEVYLHAPDDPARWVRNTLIRADARKWLSTMAARPGALQFDLIFLDPPTFSNSKAMEDHFDIQRDHAALIADAMRLLAPAGTLYFSTNRRRFKLDAELAEHFTVQDITAKTLDEDFRRPPPVHRCWAIRAASEPATRPTD
ncbi:MAG: bifunctional 23S rRNA (guanine(2069)-N(7))-methyltransferase RlmK/23S rRNA (guanine(2445)-N(2))-methyltransferase RlmL [Nevskiaceae bacterium]|nr:MAG: bifunctional 23S rRNA (guanine(2069)-N(7))-methyltransferase RlmK/23S rRNA (guanine(2445)-N(2))-methyltransferase RlmL [Nevskiaceae bacterium]TBR71805.1 MAG: bifunctional 23S rRNA (guanine(2069)-N(7))-methyltransferase RlmK/23S rRNA (guanine(2445)-N(2))-methyltransferase RlmL [Nevskiaceae bacterium]